MAVAELMELDASTDDHVTSAMSVNPDAIGLFDVLHAVQAFVTDLPAEIGLDVDNEPQVSFSSLLDELRAAAQAQDEIRLLNVLSELLAQDHCSELVVLHFRPLVPELIARWYPQVPVESSTSLSAAEIDDWEQKLAILASFASIAPKLWNSIHRFVSLSPFYQEGPLALTPYNFSRKADGAAQPDYSSFLATDSTRLHRLLLAYYRLLQADPELPHRKETLWIDTPLYELFDSPSVDKPTRLLALRAYALQRGLADRTVHELEVSTFDGVGIESTKTEEMQIAYGWKIVESDDGPKSLQRVRIDAWILPEMEKDRRAAARRNLDASDGSIVRIAHENLSPWTTILGDRLTLRSIPRPSSSAAVSGPIHVDTASSINAIRQMTLLIDLRRPILLSSPPSAGKTHLISYLASQLYPTSMASSRIVTISLADTSIDAKALLGSYVSSPTQPGTFAWVDGAVVKALREGRWIILEDIDKASMEMLSLFSRIADSMGRNKMIGGRARLDLPSEGQVVEAGEGFALIATRSVGSQAPPMFLHAHLYDEVVLAEPQTDEILQILSVKHPRLAGPPAQSLLTAYTALKRVNDRASTTGRASGRPLSLRDLEKWCARVSKLLPTTKEATPTMLESASAIHFANPAVQDEVCLEAIDVFLAAIHTGKFASPTANHKRRALAQVLGESLGLNEERSSWLLEKRVPSVEVTQPASRSRQHSVPVVRIGRSTLQGLAPRPNRSNDLSSRPYAFTKPSSILLERIAVGISLSEPLLLVGETGTGKTTAVQQLAGMLNRPLTVVNLSTQTESGDLFGSFKPVDPSVPARDLHSRWVDLFRDSFSRKKNENFEAGVRKSIVAQRWKRVADMWRESGRLAVDRLNKRLESQQRPAAAASAAENAEDAPRKRRKVADDELTTGEIRDLLMNWSKLIRDIESFEKQHVNAAGRLVFSFVEGPLVRALRNGEWILFDEINLASQETLESLTILLESPESSVILTERGDLEPIPRHSDFRAFACMNPATDVGKKDLPPALRARFTEVFAPAPDDDYDALLNIIAQYLKEAAASDRALVPDVAEFYAKMKMSSASKEIVDGTDTAPHYSMRTLTRALSFAVDTIRLFGLRRALWEGCLMTFAMSLEKTSYEKARALCQQHLLSGLRNPKAALSQLPSLPVGCDADDFVRFGHYWLEKGDEPVSLDERYVMTPSVQTKLSDLARIILTRKFPVLIQGPTSAGKTSAVEYLAKQTGHKFVRINNHEHTDIQEYLGSYASDPTTGKLAFREGVLVEALRKGHWLVLDELNLAPTDVLEALNRLLDDNRELMLPETQEIIKPHPHFMLFATQNPPGLYAGRKVLSRAFRNRFLEVHFDDVPQNELEIILCQRCAIAPSYAKKIVQVFEELRRRRQASRVFESKQSFATLRDLFRWAGRQAGSYQELAENGYMLLAERARREEDKVVVKQVLEQVMKASIDEDALYTISADPSSAFGRLGLPLPTTISTSIVWTSAMQRLFTLVATAARCDEPLLLVGETGCGKTSVCEVLAKTLGRELIGVNCHQNMETADLLGSQRPLRNRAQRLHGLMAIMQQVSPGLEMPQQLTVEGVEAIYTQLKLQYPSDERLDDVSRGLKECSAMFEWHDGPLIKAMQGAGILLLDELSLADDSVLERLNSVLEPAKTLVLAEKGGSSIEESTIVGAHGFQVVATMNPGGDFGKKELSPALRNRFTEIWVSPINKRDDLVQIIDSSWKHQAFRSFGGAIIDFLDWFSGNVLESSQSGIGLRDILAWVAFMDVCKSQTSLSDAELFLHAADMIVIDGLETLPSLGALPRGKRQSLRKLCSQTASGLVRDMLSAQDASAPVIELTDAALLCGPYALPRHGTPHPPNRTFDMDAPTTRSNVLRIVRACQMPKAVLLEGSPGVGKTTLVQAIAGLCGKRLCRINLSDQTDLIDLFGADLPVAGGNAGEFAWSDAAFLTAMQDGDWVLLDEMNLASQAVLEGLNAVLDHRGTVFIPELGRSFERHPEFRIFAAQNPMQQGGGRKGLPKSFLNRFTKVYVEEHTAQDLASICLALFPELPRATVEKVVAFNSRLQEETMTARSIGLSGSPWEFNLRDIARWLSLDGRRDGLELEESVLEFVRTIYVLRFRTRPDQVAVEEIAKLIFGKALSRRVAGPRIGLTSVQAGHSVLDRSTQPARPLFTVDGLGGRSFQHQAFLKCLQMRWPVILVGAAGSGKREMVRQTAQSLNAPIVEFNMHPGVDTMEMLGSFEQTDTSRSVQAVLDEVVRLVDQPNMHALASDERVQGLIREIKSASTNSSIRAGQSLLAVLDSQQGYQDQVARLSSALGDLSVTGSKTGFEWVDGPLVKAMRSGSWYLINDANLCGSAVLDRLNGLCEPNGSLILSEKGSSNGATEELWPHPDFRLIFAFDPKNGELSRAMRNRGLELFIEFQSNAQMKLDLEKRTSSFAGIATTLLKTGHYEVERTLRHLLVAMDRHDVDADSLRHFVQKATLVRGLQMREVLESRSVSAELLQDFPIDLSAVEQLTPPLAARALSRFICEHLSADRELASLKAADFGTSRSVLAQSAQAARMGSASRSKAAGVISKILPLMLTLREAILDSSLGHIAELPALAQRLELIQDLATLIQTSAESDVVDVALLAVCAHRLNDLIRTDNAAAHRILASLQLSITPQTGHGQKAIWERFRKTGDVEFVVEALKAMPTVGLNGETLSAAIDVFATVLYGDLATRTAGLAEIQALVARFSENALRKDTSSTSKGLIIGPLQRSLIRFSSNKLARQSFRASPSFASLAVETFGLESQNILMAAKAIDQGRVSQSVAFDLLSNFFAAIWTGDNRGTKYAGPGALIAPSDMLVVTSFKSNSFARLRDLDLRHKLLQDVKVALATAWTFQEAPLYEHIDKMAGSLLIEVVRCFLPSLDLEDIQLSRGGLRDTLAPISSVLRESDHQWLRVDFADRLAALAITLVDSVQSRADALVAIGQAIVALYVPDIALDPAVDQEADAFLIERQRLRLEEELAARLATHQADLGVDEPLAISEARAQLDSVVAILASLEGGRRRSDPALLDAFYNEVHQFLRGPFDAVKLQRLATHVSKAEEESFQIACEAFLRRLRQGYPTLSDLSGPIELAVGATRMGVRLACRESERLEVRSTARAAVRHIEQLTTFPSLEGREAVAAEASVEPIVGLSAISSNVVAGQGLDRHLGRIRSIFFNVAQAAEEERIRLLREQQAADSLYRQKTTEEVVLSDAELEAKEFAQLFPQYDDPEAEDAVDEGVTKPSDKQGIRIYQLQLQIFGGGKPHAPIVEEVLNGFVEQNLGKHATAFDERLDLASRAFLLREVGALDREAAPTDEFDFYRSPCPREAQKMARLVQRIRARLQELISEWPDQMVLQHILDRTESLLDMTLVSPVPRLLSGLELLLTHTDDWEEYANRDNSLQAYRSEMTSQIIDWRRLELAEWRTILAKQHQAYNLEIAPWWHSLYRLLVLGFVELGDAEKSPIQEVVPLLVEYLSSSSVGQFEARLDLLRSFDRFICAAYDNQASQMAHTVIVHVCDAYGQFLPAIRASLQAQVKPLEKNMNDFVKLASWKDVNVHALKASAKKTHGQLFKVIRKLREALRQPASTHFQPGPSHPLGELPALSASWTPLAIFAAPSEHSLFDRFVKVVKAVDCAGVGAELDELSIEIIETTASLSKATPSSLTDKNAKEVKSLAIQKRRALADLLKALKAMGFSAKVRADQLAKQSSFAQLAQLPLLSDAASQSILDYHHRLGFCMPAMRQSLVEHNADILTQDLQRAFGFAESAYASSLHCRSELQRASTSLEYIRLKIERFSTLLIEGIGLVGARVFEEITHLHGLAVWLKSALTETSARLQDVKLLKSLDVNIVDLESATSAGCSLFDRAVERMTGLQSLLEKTRVPILSRDEAEDVVGICAQAEDLRSRLESLRPSLAAIDFLVAPICEKLATFKPITFDTAAETGSVDAANAVIDHLLVAAQESFKSQVHPKTDEPLLSRLQRVSQHISQRSGHQSVAECLSELDAQIGRMSSTSAQATLDAVLPFLAAYGNVFESHVAELAASNRSLYKLTFILSQLFRTLAERGFCKPQEQSDEKSGQSEGQMSEGTGLGAGSGSKNVSDEIEDESQVEGLRGEEEDQDDQSNEKEEGDDDAVSMQDDFAGDLEDVSGDEGEDSDGEKEDGEDEMDDHVGDVDEAAVDEQFWQGDDPTEQQGGDEVQDGKTEQDQSNESDLAAKEEEPKSSSKEKPKPEQQQGEGEDEAPDGPEEESNDQGSEGGEDETAGQDDDAADPSRQQPDQHVPEVETLDLPEGMDLDDAGSEDGADEDVMDDESEDDGQGHGDGSAEEEYDEEGEMDRHEEGDMAAGEVEDDANDADEGDDGQQLMPQEQAVEEQAQSAQEASSGGGGGAGEMDSDQKEEIATMDDAADEQREQEQTDSTDAKPASNNAASADDSAQEGADGEVSSGGAPQQTSSGDQSKSLGDRLKEVHRMLDEIQERSSRETEQNQANDEQALGQVEHIKDDEDAQLQALGAAESGSKGEKLADLNIAEQQAAETEQCQQMPGMEVDGDEMQADDNEEDVVKREDQDTSDNIVDKALTRAQVMADADGRDLQDAEDMLEDDRGGVDEDADLATSRALEDLDVKSEGDDEEVNGATGPTSTSRAPVNGVELWRKYASLTSDLSYQLCEQLRLILEPTLATRLQGDYRTGKRLNMRKIIPYIASECTKDKIWLRRTKPSKREYQVLLSLDDSRSMSDGQSVHLAYQTLALVAQALSKLEVGQIGIARFGEDVELLHAFSGDSGGFGDADGARVMESFSFSQHGTDVARLVERSLEVLEDARQAAPATSSGADLWQLEIIISDGVCQDHDRLRKLLRKAMEQRVMIVFLIVDSLHKSAQTTTTSTTAVPVPSASRTSILDMQTVSYKTDATTGEMKLEMERYLDNFPFAYFAILRDVEALPEVLSDTLRQWMQRVSTSNE